MAAWTASIERVRMVLMASCSMLWVVVGIVFCVVVGMELQEFLPVTTDELESVDRHLFGGGCSGVGSRQGAHCFGCCRFALAGERPLPRGLDYSWIQQHVRKVLAAEILIVTNKLCQRSQRIRFPSVQLCWAWIKIETAR